MSKNNNIRNRNNKQYGRTKTLQIPLTLQSISITLGIIGAIAVGAFYVGYSYNLIQTQDEKHQLQCEILHLKEQIIADKEKYRINEEELYLKIRALADENSELKK